MALRSAMETLNNGHYTTQTNNGLPQLMENHKLLSRYANGSAFHNLDVECNYNSYRQ